MNRVTPTVKPRHKNVTVFIDGFNLYHAIERLKKNHLKWLNVSNMAQGFLRQDETLRKVYMFTALTYGDQGKQDRHRSFMAASRASAVDVMEARFKRAKKFCVKQDRYCKFWEEKESDVAIAVGMIAEAHSGAAQRIVLVTADTDQIPAVRYIRNNFPQIEMSLYIPPGRKDEARDLGACFDDPREIDEGRLAANLLSARVPDNAGGFILRPTDYDPPQAAPA